MDNENFDVKKFMTREYESRNFYPIYAGIKSSKKESFLADRTPEELYQIMLMSKYTLVQQYVKYAGMTVEKSDMSDLMAYLSDYQMILEQWMEKGNPLSDEQKRQLETEVLDVIAKADKLENIDSLAGYEEYLKQLDVKIDMTGLLDMFGKVDLTSEDTLSTTVGDLLNYSYQFFGMEEEMNGEEVTPTPVTTTKRRARAKVATYATTPGVTYQAHVQSIGWMSSVSNGSTGGTTGQNKAMEAFKLSLSNASSGDGITYRAHVKDNGWLGWVSNGATGGTTGQNKTLQAFQIKLTGSIAQTYSVVYRAHVDNVGWQNWQADGATAGTTGQGLAVQAIQIMLVKKGEEVSVANGAYYIYAGDSNFLLDISANGTADKTNVDIWNAGQSGFGRCEQKWVILKQSDGWYKIMGNYSRKCLDLFGGSNQSVQNIDLYTDNGSASQRWKFYNYNGKYVIKNKCGTVLDFQNATLANGTNVQSYAQLNGTAQLWRLAKITNDTVYLKPSSSNGHGYTASAPTNNMHDAYQRLQYTGGTIQIMDNWNVTSNVTLTNNSYTNSSASSLNLLSGCTLGFKRYSGFTAARNMFYATGGSLTLKNLVLDGNRANLSKVSTMIYSTVPLTLDGCTMQNSSTYNDASFIVADGNVNATNCNFKDNYSTRSTQNHSIGGIWMNVNTVGTFTGCNFSGNTSNSAVLIYFSKGIFKKCTFKSNGVNKSSGYASALGSNAGDLELYDCDFEDNYAMYDGGAIHLNNNPETSNDNNRGHFYAEGCSFTNNGCGGGAAAIMLFDTRQTATIKNCTFTNNKATSYAGAIAAMLQTKLILTGNKFIGNAVTGTNANGGAVYSDYSKTDTAITATNNTFDGNTTPTTGSCSGGAVRVAKGNAEFDQNIWMNNKSVWGGAVDIQSSATATMKGESFSNNSSSSEGGAVHNNGTLTVSDGIFKDNNSKYGGAIFNNGSLDVKSDINEATTGIFESNVAVNGGAIFSQTQSSGATYKFASTGMQYTGNKAIDSGATVSSNKNAGGAIYINNNTKNNTIKNNKYKNNSAYYGGAVHVAADATCTSSGETYVENSVNGGGGAFHSNGTSTITLGTFKKNMSSVGGGAIESAGITNISNSKLEENTADEGGAIHVCQVIDGTAITSKLTSTANDYISNTARKGGAIVVDTKSTVDSFNDNIQGCSATQIGGAFMNVATLSIYGGTIGNEAANTAGEKGGAVYHEGKVFNMSNDASIDKNNDVYLTPGKYITVPGILNKDFVARITPSDYTPGRTVVKNTYGVKGSTIEPKFTLTPKTGFFLKGGDTYSVTNNADVVISRNYTITYDANGGTGGPENQKKEWNVDTSISSKKPTQKGYVFEGWNTEADGSGDDYFPGDDYTENDDLTLYAQWMPIKYTVTYDGNGSTSGSMLTQTFTYGTSYNLAANGFVRSNYHFTGWNTKADGSGTSYADKQSVKNLASTHGAKITLYAQWVKNTYTICFHANGGIGSMVDVTVPYDTSYKLPTNKFTYQGYTFDKWKTEDGTSVYGNEAAIKYSSSQLKNGVLNLYAQWKINQYTLTITGDSGVETITGSGTYNYGTTANVTYQIKPGYHIKNITGTTADGDPNGVWTGHAGKGGTVNDTWTVKVYNRTIVVHTEPNTYAIKYDGNGSTGGSTANSSHTYDTAKALTANGYTRTGYSFNGWNTKADGSGTAYADEASVKNLTTTNGGTVTLYAQWTKNSYYLDLNGWLDGKSAGNITGYGTADIYVDGVQKANDVTDFYQKIPFGSKYEIKDIKTVTGHTYVGVHSGSITGTIGTGNVGVVLEFKTNKYTVSFDKNNGTGTMTNQTFTYGVKQALIKNTFTRTGYTFAGWNTQADGKGTTYTDQQEVISLSAADGATVRLYAQWTAISYTVTYDGNGSTGGSTASSSHTYDTAKALTANGFTKTGYTFKGWNTKADGSGASYSDKQSVKNLTSTNGGTVTLYAQWIANQYTVAYNANGGTGSMATDTVTYGIAYKTKTNAFTRVGYTFTGWNEKADGTGTDWTSWIGKDWTWTYTKNVTLYAQWKINQYSLIINPNGGAYGGTTANTTMCLNYGTKQEIAETPIREGYTFQGWNRTGSGSLHSGHASEKSSTITMSEKRDDDGTAYTKYTMNYTNTGTGNSYPNLGFFYYPYVSGHTYRVSYDVRVNTSSGFGYSLMRHAGFRNNWEATANDIKNVTDGWKHKTIERTFTGTEITQNNTANAINPLVEWYGSIPAGKTGVLDMDLKNLTVYDVTAGTYVKSKTAAVKNNATVDIGAGNTMLTAVWKANTYTVKYDGNGSDGGSTSSSSHTYDVAKALTANSYTRTGYTFKNWNTKADGTGTTYTDKQSVKNLISTNGATVTLYAQWTANKYTVTIHPNNGTLNVSDSSIKANTDGTYTANVIYGSTNYNALGVSASRTGYQMLGFYDNTSGGTKLWNSGGACLKDGKYWNASNQWCYAGNVDIYPQWKANTYTVKYDGNGATGGSSASSSHIYDAAKDLTANGYIRTGYIFKNWNTQADGKGVSYADKASVKNLTSVNGATVILYAQWSINSYTLTYNPNGGSVSPTSKSLTYNSAYGTLPTPTRKGYAFTGWFTAASGGTKVSESTKMGAGNITIYAHWKANVLRVNYYPNGATKVDSSAAMDGSGVSTITPDAQYRYDDFNYDATMPSYGLWDARRFIRTGYTSTNKYHANSVTGTILLDAGNNVYVKTQDLASAVGKLSELEKGNVTISIYADWKANTYTVKYNGNNNTGGSTASSSHTYDTAKELTANGFTKTGYTFKSWNTKADGTGTSYGDKASVKNLTATAGGNVTLYAQWTANKYTVAFDANGGTGTMATQELTYDKAENLSANSFKRAGYKFNGWNTKADGTGTSYADKASVKNLTASGTVTLYAKWYSAAPVLEAKDATYYEGQEITKATLLKNVTKASDAEDGDMTGKVIITKIEYAAGKLVDGKSQAAYTKSWTDGMPDSEKLDTWFLQLPKEKAPVTHKITYQVTDLSGKTTTKTSTITVKYNEFPVMKAEDRYFTLEDAKAGKITQDVLLKDAITSDKLKATDAEDGTISNRITIVDYKDTDFKNVNGNTVVWVTFKVKDSMGKETIQEIKVNVIDSGSDYWRDDDEAVRKQVRFITQKYYDKNKDADFHGMTTEEIEASSDNGGLNVMSKWYQNAAYKALLTGSFAKDAGTDYKISAEKAKELKQKIESNGIGNSKSSNALTDIYNSLK